MGNSPGYGLSRLGGKRGGSSSSPLPGKALMQTIPI